MAPPLMPVYAFDDVIDGTPDERVDILGGKGAGLVEMTQTLGLPVPPGFVLGTPLCAQVIHAGLGGALHTAVKNQLARLEARTGRLFGAGPRPLLVSVRSGARVSMPGMMDTVLNLGANEQTVLALALETGSRLFAWDTWWRFCRMYTSTVVGLQVSEEEPDAGRVRSLSEPARIASLQAAIKTLRHRCAQAGRPIPDDPHEQLRFAIEAVFRSSRSERARVYREREKIDDEVPTAVVVQAMVYGNFGADSGTGVAFTRNPSTGENQPLGDYLPNAQGEDVVAGSHKPLPLDAMAQNVPQAYSALRTAMVQLELHYRDLCDVEFTVQNARLFVLQTRIGKRSAQAAVRIAVEMAQDPRFGLSKAEALARINADQVRQLQSRAVITPGAQILGQGVGVSPGVVSGVVCLDPDRVTQWTARGHRVVLVRHDTSPHDVHGMVASAAIVSATGGPLCHAALVARAWGIVGVCGVQGLQVSQEGESGALAGRPLLEGDVVSVDGGTGHLYAGDVTEALQAEPPELSTLRQWAAEIGQVLGETTDTGLPVDLPAAVPPLTSLALLRALGLAGFARAEKLAVMVGHTVADVQAELMRQVQTTVEQSPRGWHLSPEGKAQLAAALLLERGAVDRVLADSIYHQFMALDATLKRVITDWQLRSVAGQSVPNDHLDKAYDAKVLERLFEMHRACELILPKVLQLSSRLWPYPKRLDRAARAIEAGDHSMIASPLKDSYHSIWFELHEELIQLSGRDRATEEGGAH